jgi:hypothetical protein
MKINLKQTVASTKIEEVPSYFFWKVFLEDYPGAVLALFRYSIDAELFKDGYEKNWSLDKVIIEKIEPTNG